jgi:hypothetical protein
MREEKIGDNVRFGDCPEENHDLNDDPSAFHPSIWNKDINKEKRRSNRAEALDVCK